MATAPAATGPAGTPAGTGGVSVRTLGLAVLVLVIAEIALGAVLDSVTYTNLLVGVHVTIALLLVVVTAGATVVAFRAGAPRPRVAGAVSLVSALGATAAGTVYLLGSQSLAALDAMAGLALPLLIGGILMIVWGTATRPSAPA